MADPPGLVPEHADYLREHAVDPEFAIGLGVHSITTAEDLPDDFRHLGADGVPAILFAWTAPDGVDEPQIKTMDGSKGYKFRSKEQGYRAPFWEVRKVGDTGPLVIVEGSKQCLVAGIYAPPEWSVYGVSGCWGWMCDSRPTPFFELAEDRDVVVIFDSDRLTNPRVWDAAEALDRALDAEGAASVKFVDLPGEGTTGLDDLLAGKAEDRRAKFLERLLSKAERRRKTGRPKEKSSVKPAYAEEAAGDRPVIVVNDDRYEVIRKLGSALVARWDGEFLFNYGGVICQRRGATMLALTSGAFKGAVAKTCRTISIDDKGRPHDAWPDSNCLDAVLDYAGRFTQLDKITQVPFVRQDGTICQTPGYDLASRTYLVADESLGEIVIPDSPTSAQLRDALELLRDDLLKDFPFLTDADRANAIGLFVTPFIRGLVDLVPLAVVDGKEAGSGKNLLANCLQIVVTGRTADPLPYSSEDAENRKVITTAFTTGAELFVFDEAHKLDGPSLARALTAPTYQDRILGGNKMASYPNRVTWVSLGNQVTVGGDIGRRVYRIALHYMGESPENRSSFKHPDLEQWARENRGPLVAACLTLVRAWYAAGKPKAELPFTMGSFTQWQKIIGGVLANAGVTDFLANVKTWRSESDFDRQYWSAHIAWLHEKFGDAEFTTGDVQRALDRAGRDAACPPNLDDPTAVAFTKALGQAYSRQKDRVLDGYTLAKAGQAHGHVSKWKVTKGDGAASKAAGSGGDGGTGGLPNPSRTTEKNTSLRADAHVCFARMYRGAGGPLGPPVPPGAGTPSPIDHLLHLIEQPKAPPCPHCAGTKEAVPPAGILLLCRSCFPQSFSRN